MNYLTCKQIAEQWALPPRRVQDLCKAGLIPGAVRHGREWLIPADAKKPADRRKGESLQPMDFADNIQPFFIKFRPGELDKLLPTLEPDNLLHDLFRAQIHIYRGETQRAKEILLKHKADHMTASIRGLLSTTLSLCATVDGDLRQL